MTVIDPDALARLEALGGEELKASIIGLFLEDAPTRVAAARAAAAAGDLSGVERAVHSLKSSAAHVGAGDLQRRAAELERQTAGGDGTELAARVAALAAAWEEARAALQQLGGPGA